MQKSLYSRSIHHIIKSHIGSLTCWKFRLGPKKWLLNDFVDLLRESLKDWWHSDDHIFEERCLYVERAVGIHLDFQKGNAPWLIPRLIRKRTTKRRFRVETPEQARTKTNERTRKSRVRQRSKIFTTAKRLFHTATSAQHLDSACGAASRRALLRAAERAAHARSQKRHAALSNSSQITTTVTATGLDAWKRRPYGSALAAG
jgi:hypothetical protein